MLKHRTRLVCFALFTAAALLLTACSGSGSSTDKPAANQPVNTPAAADTGKPVDGGMFTIGLTSDIVTLNPTMYDDVASGDLVQFLYANLYDIDSHGDILVDDWSIAAEPPKVSADQKTYTVKLKTGPKWSDGAPITAQDVAFSINVMAGKEYGSPNYSLFAQVKEVRVKDPTTLEIELKDVDARFLPTLNFAPIPEKSFQGVKPADFQAHPFGTDIKKTITSGPYVWKAWQEKQSLTVEADPNFWGKKPHIQTVVFKIYASQQTAVQAVINGDIDFYENAPVAQLDAVTKAAGLHVESSASPLYDYISFNFNPDNWPDKFVPFAGTKTRQAISYAINRKGMVDSVLKGYGTLLNGPFLPGFWAYTEGASFDYPFDAAKAKALLAEDGWKAGSDGILVKDGHRFEFEILYRADNQRRQNFAQVIQQNLADVGIKMSLKPLEFSALIDEHVDPGKYEAYLGGWQLGLDPDIESILGSGFFPPGGQNSGFYKNETVDKLAAQGYRTNDKAQRKAIYAQVAKALSDDPPYVFLCQTNYNTIYNSRVHWAEADKPIQSLPYGYIFHVFNWWVTK